MENGIYIEAFAVVDGKRVHLKTVSYKYLANKMVENMLDGLEKIVTVEDEKGELR